MSKSLVIASAFLFLLGPVFGAEEMAFEGIGKAFPCRRF